MVLVGADEGGRLETFVACALASMFRVVLPTFGKISPYFYYKTQVVGCKRVFKIFLEKQDETENADVAEEIKNILIYGHKNGALGHLYASPLVEGDVMEIEVKLVKAINHIKNPRFW
jgi:hypothetical protein